MGTPSKSHSARYQNGSCGALWIFPQMPSDTSLKAILSGPFSFTARPEPVAGDLRMSWGIAVLLMALLNCRAKKSSFQKLQFLAHAVRLPESRDDVRAMLSGALRPSEISVRV